MENSHPIFTEYYLTIALAILLLLLLTTIILLYRKSVSYKKIYNQFKDIEIKKEGIEKDYEKLKSHYKKIYNRFKGIVDIETEKKKVAKNYQKYQSDVEIRKIKIAKDYRKYQSDYEKMKKEVQLKVQNLRDSYNSKRVTYNNLLKEISVLEEDMEYISVGIYKPHFDYDTSDKYKQKITEVRTLLKDLVRKRAAAVCHKEWTVEGSKREGQKMTNRNIKLMLRAFNNECESAILKVRWNNVDKMEKRIIKAFEALNKLGEPNHIEITKLYLEHRLNELYLAHEYKEKLHEEKEEQKRIKAQLREEKKAQREIEKAKKQTEQKEKRYQKALEKAQKAIEKAHGEELSTLTQQLSDLEQKLKEAQEMKERALSRAQLTKSGHVYVISNIGSFGKNVYKIGMTRRLEPLDRVRELGGASVPFRFDVHAMIYTDNAPELENKLHKKLRDKSVNLVNSRKEFFNVSLGEIEKIVKENNAEIEISKVAEAREYRESLAIISERDKTAQQNKKVEEKFPLSI